MARTLLGQFCREYVWQHGGEYARVYNSLMGALLGGKVRGEKVDGSWTVRPDDARKWLATRGQKAARRQHPLKKPFTPNFRMQPGDPYLPLFVDEHGRPLDPSNPMKGIAAPVNPQASPQQEA